MFPRQLVARRARTAAPKPRQETRVRLPLLITTSKAGTDVLPAFFRAGLGKEDGPSSLKAGAVDLTSGKGLGG